MKNQKPSSSNSYKENYEKFKDVKITNGRYKNADGIQYEVTDLNEITQMATVITVKSGFSRLRTLHWCRRHLIPA